MSEFLCKYEKCLQRGKHWANPEGQRSRQIVDRPDAYCSIECKLYDEANEYDPLATGICDICGGDYGQAGYPFCPAC